MGTKRETWVDAAKGMAIIFVVLGHVVSSYHNSNLLTDAAAFNFIHTLAYSFHMALFFALSGYLAVRSARTGSKLSRIGKRVLGLGVPYVVFTVATWGVKFALSFLSNTEVSIQDLLKMPVYPLSFMWYIYALLIMSVLHILLEKLLSSKQGVLIALAAALVLRVVLTWGSWINSTPLSGSVLESVGNYLFWYLLGVAFATFWRYKPLDGAQWRILAAAGLAAYVVVVWLVDRFQLEGQWISMPVSAAGVCLVAVAAMCMPKSKLLAYLGKNSLPIYLLHGIVLSAARIVLSKLGLPLLQGAVPMVLCGALGILVPLACYWVCKKVPVLDFCFYPGKYLKKSKRNAL